MDVVHNDIRNNSEVIKSVLNGNLTVLYSKQVGVIIAPEEAIYSVNVSDDQHPIHKVAVINGHTTEIQIISMVSINTRVI